MEEKGIIIVRIKKPRTRRKEECFWSVKRKEYKETKRKWKNDKAQKKSRKRGA
jgi:hypothetical protein